VLASHQITRLTIVLSLFVLGLGGAKETLVREFAGSGLSNTRPFSVDESWEIQWDAKGDFFQLYIYNLNGDLLNVAANQMGPGRGSSYQVAAGTFYLQVNALGSWSVRIVQVESNKLDGGQSDAANFDGASYSGSGAQNTRPFTVDGPWEVHWNAAAGIFQIYLYNLRGELIDVAANQMGSGAGSSFQPKGGTYYLQVNATGNWKIKIVPYQVKQ
jgi:hypothetical protein